MQLHFNQCNLSIKLKKVQQNWHYVSTAAICMTVTGANRLLSLFFFSPALLSAFLSLHAVSESPAFVICSAWWYSARYSLCKTFSESGPQCPYWRTLTKAPLFHVYISSSGSEKQEIQLPLMRKGLHTPLVVLSTWNPGRCGRNTAK